MSVSPKNWGDQNIAGAMQSLKSWGTGPHGGCAYMNIINF
jgi:hypothetical protein